MHPDAADACPSPAPAGAGRCDAPGEDALQELVTSLLSEVPQGVFLCDAAGRLQAANRAFLALAGREAIQLRGLHLAELVSGEDRRGLARCCRALERGESRGPWVFELAGPGGERRPVSASALRLGSGPDARLVGVVCGRSAPKGCDDGKAQSGHACRTLLNASPNSALLLDADGNILETNEEGARRLGGTPAGIIGRNVLELLPAEIAEVRREKGRQAIRKGRPVRFEDQIGEVIFEHLILPVAGTGGQIDRLAVYSFDITERKIAEHEHEQLQAQLQLAQKMEAIGTLAGGIAHDFNNLMMAIQGNVSLMALNLADDHPHRQLLKNIERTIQSGSELTAKLLGYARKGKYEVKPVDLNALVGDITEAFARMRKDITIVRELSAELCAIQADRGQLEQVLFNLLVNAADAMPRGGRLTIKTRNVTHESLPTDKYHAEPGTYALMTVADTGTGMTPEVMERIFDPFFTTKKMGRGTGLGLASAYGIVKSHRGYIEVESEVGRGTTFYIYLPAAKRRPRPAPAPAPAARSGSGTVLLVDDELNVLSVTAKMLSRSGYTVIEAAGGQEAVARFAQHAREIDLVILDMVMPEMGGGEVFDRIKAIDPSAKVLLASGFSLEGQAREIMKRGCDGFIQKPFTLEDLLNKVQHVLEDR